MARTNWRGLYSAAKAAVTVSGSLAAWSLASAQVAQDAIASGNATGDRPAAGIAPCMPGQRPPADSAVDPEVGNWTAAEIAALDCPQPPIRPVAPDIFGQAAAPIGSIAIRSDWVSARSLTLTGAEPGLDELLGQANALTGDSLLDMVNRWANWHLRYADDSNGDVWSGAAVTLDRGFGDCEDFAIAKMAILQQLGVPLNDMFLVLVRKPERPFDHAVLAVRRDGSMYILDNMTDYLQIDSQIAHYRPTMSYSGSFAWIYGARLSFSKETARSVDPVGSKTSQSAGH